MSKEADERFEHNVRLRITKSAKAATARRAKQGATTPASIARLALHEFLLRNDLQYRREHEEAMGGSEYRARYSQGEEQGAWATNRLNEPEPTPGARPKSKRK